MRFVSHFHEQPPRAVKDLFGKYERADHKIAFWNSFVDSELTGVNEDDCSVLPRVLPASYLPVIRKTAREITTFVLRLLSLPENEIRAIVPSGPIRDFLIEELEVLRFRPKRLVGSFRFDMAIVGPPDKQNPPKLLEINEIGFDGLARSSFIQKTILSLIPELKKRAISLDTAGAEVRNMMRLGPQVARFQYDCYNWDEEYLLRTAQSMGADVKLVSPAQLGCVIDDEYPLLAKESVTFRNGRVRIGSSSGPGSIPDAVQMSFAFELEDYKKGRRLYQQLVRSKTPQYGPFITGLVASKMILVLLADPHLRKKFLGTSRRLDTAILPAFPLKDNVEETRKSWNRYVLKYTDGYGGKHVFMGPELLKRLNKIKSDEFYQWIVQERTRLNTLKVSGILSKPRRVISDLGVFVQYDWANGNFRNFEVGGFITRATNRSYKVNVSGGGIQVPVLFLKGQ